MQFRFAALAPAVVALAACQPNAFTVEVKGETTVAGDPSPVPAVLNAFPSIGSFTDVDFQQSQDFKNQGVSPNQIQSVKPDAISLKIVSPESQDFTFLETLQFYAQTGDQEVLVAQKTGIDKLGLKGPNPVLELDVTNAELKPFITAPSTSIVVRGRGRQPPQDTRLEATVGLKVTVNLL
jgi:hypothetical protein